jgi:hypothetical protein
MSVHLILPRIANFLQFYLSFLQQRYTRVSSSALEIDLKSIKNQTKSKLNS